MRIRHRAGPVHFVTRRAFVFPVRFDIKSNKSLTFCKNNARVTLKKCISAGEASAEERRGEERKGEESQA
jgi:hypothetical protein